MLKTGLSLSPRELLFIATLLDATELLGVSDAFFGMEDEEIQQEMAALQASIEEKGYAVQDFEGRFTIGEEVEKMVDICANCEIFVVVDKNRVNRPQHRELYYAKGGRIIRLMERDGEYILEPISSIALLLEQTLQNIVFTSSEPLGLQEVRITHTVLEEAKALSNGFDTSAGLKILMKAGCNEPSARAILDGLSVKTNYYAVIITIFDGDNEGVYSAMLIDTEEGIYKVTTLSDNDENALLFEPLTANLASALLEGVIRRNLGNSEESFI